MMFLMIFSAAAHRLQMYTVNHWGQSGRMLRISLESQQFCCSYVHFQFSFFNSTQSQYLRKVTRFAWFLQNIIYDDIDGQIGIKEIFNWKLKTLHSVRLFVSLAPEVLCLVVKSKEVVFSFVLKFQFYFYWAERLFLSNQSAENIICNI